MQFTTLVSFAATQPPHYRYPSPSTPVEKNYVTLIALEFSPQCTPVLIMVPILVQRSCKRAALLKYIHRGSSVTVATRLTLLPIPILANLALSIANKLGSSLAI